MHSRVTINRIAQLTLLLSLSQVVHAEDDETAIEAVSPEAAPVLPGEAAPEWKVVAWTDGQDRDVGSLRDKIVVLDFWGTWCGGGLQTVPVLKKLERRYAEKDVVFLSIHTAGTEMEVIKDVLQREGWSIPTGLDRGESPTDGTTVRRFGIVGYPTVVVIGHDGTVTYNSSADMMPERSKFTLQEYEEICRDLAIPWPITFEGNRNREEVMADLQLLATSLYRRKIDAAIAARVSANSVRRDKLSVVPSDAQETSASSALKSGSTARSP